MKTRILIPLIVALFCWNADSQTADDWVSQGRSYLATHDIPDANASFAQALTLNPSHETANALYAITRVLVLPGQPAGSNFLTRIGFPVAGRNIYGWTSTLFTDTNGLVLAPVGVNANEFTAQLRTNVLPVVSGAISNLAAITDTNFTLNLTSDETSVVGVRVDYGDLKLIQAALYGAEYIIYTLNAQNLDAQLTALRDLYTNGTLSAEEVLKDYPQLLTFATTNDLQNALAAFTNAVNTYYIASAFIRSRPASEVRLFNYNQVSDKSEGSFRLVLRDLKNSLLAGPQMFTLDPDLFVDMTPLFYDPAPWRSWLPQFDGNAIILGSFPDLTFGGVIDELITEDAEGFLSTYFRMLPVGSAPELSDNNTLNLAFTTLRGHYYALEASTNLADWQMVEAFTASSAVSVLTDSLHGAKCFYRLRDNTGFLAFSGVVLDQNTGVPIADAQVQIVGDGTTTFTDANGQFYLQTSLPATWHDNELEISATGYTTIDNYYYGNGLVSGLQIYLSPPPPNDDFSNRTVLAGTNLMVTGSNVRTSQESGEPNPTGDAAGRSVWWSWTAPVDGTLQIDATTSSFWPLIEIYTGNNLSLLDAITNGGGSVVFHVTAGTTYQIALDGYQDDYSSSGTIRFSLNYVYVSAPANDDFSNRTVLTGKNLTVTGSNVGASQESGEPNPTGNAAGHSVWWSWTAPANGTLQIEAAYIGSSFSPLFEIFTGNNLSSLDAIANGQGSVMFQVTAGTTYQIALDGNQWDYPYWGAFRFSLNFMPAPPNDNFANRTVLNGSNVSTNGNNSAASWEAGEPYDTYYYDDYGYKSVWFSWTAPSPGLYTVSVNSGSVSYPILAVYTGTQLSTLSTVTDIVGDDRCAADTINAATGQTYQIEIDDNDGNGSNYSLRIAPTTILALDNSLNNLSGTIGSQTLYKITIPAGLTALQISISGGTGDCDLYVKFNSPPTLDSWDYCPYVNGNNETVNISNPTAGDWYIMLNGYNNYSGVTLLAQ
jgi:hypothetical protein